MDAAGDAPKVWEEGVNALNGDPEIDEVNELPKGCCAARPWNMAPGEKGIVDEDILDDERMWFDSKELGGGEEV